MKLYALPLGYDIVRTGAPRGAIHLQGSTRHRVMVPKKFSVANVKYAGPNGDLPLRRSLLRLGARS